MKKREILGMSLFITTYIAFVLVWFLILESEPVKPLWEGRGFLFLVVLFGGSALLWVVMTYTIKELFKSNNGDYLLTDEQLIRHYEIELEHKDHPRFTSEQDARLVTLAGEPRIVPGSEEVASGESKLTAFQRELLVKRARTRLEKNYKPNAS